MHVQINRRSIDVETANVEPTVPEPLITPRKRQIQIFL